MDKKFDFKIVEKGNCMLCKKELGEDDGIFICNSCKEKLKTPKIPSFDVGYDSPIKMYERQLQKDFENRLIEAVERVEIFVDRDELLKALHYDRQQYEKGFQDGSGKWNYDEPTEYNKDYLCINEDGKMAVGTYSNFGWIFGHYFKNPYAWRELPEPPK